MIAVTSPCSAQFSPALEISETAVMTRLKHVRAKTGTSLQADLVKLAARALSCLIDAGSATRLETVSAERMLFDAKAER
jgi:hypothetical protein